jgi:exopolysaccharide biosynthesis polyprenyl glycosylphosphotransferase
MLVCDLLAIGTSYLIAYEIRYLLGTPMPITAARIESDSWLLAIMAPAACFALSWVGLYQSRTYESVTGIVKAVGKAQIFAGLVLLSAMYLGKRADVSRLLLQIYLLVNTVLLIAGKLITRFLLMTRSGWLRPRRRWNVVIVGDQHDAQRYMQVLREHPYWKVHIGAVVPPAAPWRGRQAYANGAVPRTEEQHWYEILGRYAVDEVVAVSQWEDAPEFATLAEVCRFRGLTFRILVTMPEVPNGTYQIDDLGKGSYLISLDTVPQEWLPLFVKRSIDILGAVVGLIVCGIVYPWYAYRLRRESPGPVIFKQQRGGLNGREFTIYKFRTMYLDAEIRLHELKQRNEMRGNIFKIKDDPRVTPSGKIMRRLHLDELPQFWNVLKGDMSLVGARPCPMNEVNSYQWHEMRRLSMKPGVTGPWQVSGNQRISDFEEIVRLDCDYIDRWSLWRDLKILTRTIVTVTRAEGW